MKTSFVVPTRNVVLTEGEAELVERLIRCGRFRTASDVLREGLRLLADSEAAQPAIRADQAHQHNDTVPARFDAEPATVPG